MVVISTGSNECEKDKYDRCLVSIPDSSLPVAGTWSTTVARTLSGVPVERWRRKVIQGVLASVAPSTLRSYKKAWGDFMGFRFRLSGLSYNVPPTTDDVLQYLSHLDDLGRAPKTLKIHVAAISFFSKATFAHDPCGDFMIRRAIEGWSRLQPPRDEGRKPISYGLLSQIRKKLRLICWSRFEARLFSAAYAIAFFGALRVGEVVFEVSARGPNRGLLCEDVQLSSSSVSVLIRQSKTDQAGKGVLVKLTASTQQGPCPVKDTRRYLDLRPPGPGPFLIHEDGSPMSRYQFTRVLRKAIEACGLSALEYAAHSFRIGAATTAAHLGLPADRIKEMGRWRSNAYKSYIR
ncbi:integrase/recombinase xerD homolog [Podarcis muralis]